jgi:N-acetylated-alpha-linked acidic dipeptidase
MVFLQHDGVPAADMIFDGPYGVYHSVYDDYAWMARFGDPGFRYHATLSRLWGLLALRFANADLLPFDYALYATEVAAYVQSLEKISPPDFFAREIQPLLQKCVAWKEAASQANVELEAWRRGAPGVAPPGTPVSGVRWTPPESRNRTCPDKIGRAAEEEARLPISSGGVLPPAPHEINARLMAQERALVAEQGIPGRPWFRHLVYAPLPSYEAETLPGLREALEQKDFGRAREQAALLGQAIDRACRALKEDSR